MFRIVERSLAWWPVVFPGVSEEGEVVENRFEMRFVILPEDEHRAFIVESAHEEAIAIDSETMTAPSDVSLRIVGRIAADWRGVGAANGEPLKFNDEHLKQLLNVPNTFAAVMAAYRDCRLGRAGVRAGN